jgi:SpoVK/Ycf46/Vps4 family AAA+-type ATPase
VRLEAIQSEIDRSFRRVPVDGRDDRQPAEETGSETAQKIDADARNMRDEIDRARPDDSPLPTAPAPSTSQADALAEAQAELDQLIGLTNIKEEIRTLVNFLRVQEERGRAGLPKSAIGLHMVFQGNPGTGKTTVARLVGRILGAMGILKNGHVIETDRSGLVAEYAGQTAPKTNKRIDAALDGILFIDEAYSLVAERGDDPYGREALQALLKRMEDDRERLVVILAGYPEPMERLLRSNPGLSSRFNRTFNFADYTTVELAMVFDLMCRKNHYQVPTLTRAKLLLGFDWLVERRDEHFGNGRLVRNTFENATRRLANRIVDVAPLTRELLTTFEPEDVQLDEVPAEVWAQLDSPERTFEFDCPGCGKPRELRQEHLGRRVRCRECDTAFCADWGRPLPS